MKKLILLSIIFVFSGILKAQTFPYLNASTGNKGEYIVDGDSNLYMYHFNQIEKLDKNLNPVWVKKYNGMYIHSLLLSKTNSIYFIAVDSINYGGSYNPQTQCYVGKIRNNGAFEWAKFITHPTFSLININRLMLDRNDNLLLSGGSSESNNPSAGIFIKLDTLGNMLYQKNIFFSDSSINSADITILRDSSGVYSFTGAFHSYISYKYKFLKYFESGDTITQMSAVEPGNIYKSRRDSSVIYLINEYNTTTFAGHRSIAITKYRNNIPLWSTHSSDMFFPATFLEKRFDEDENSNVFFTFSPASYAGNYHNTFTNYIFKLDSNGNHNGKLYSLLSYTWWPPSSQFEQINIFSFKKNTLQFDILGAYFYDNPLSITQIDSSLTTNCSSYSSATFTTYPSSGSLPFDPYLGAFSVTSVPTYTLQNKISTTTTVANFSLTNNYCIALETKENQKPNILIKIIPNPAINIISVQLLGNFAITEMSINDIFGKKIKLSVTEKIDVSYLAAGIYFIKIKTDQGEFSQKFIKE
jgi:hypothetical protein